MADSSRDALPQFWQSTLTGEELRAAAYGFAEGLDSSEGERSRRADFLTYASQYYGRPVQSLNDFETGVGGDGRKPAGGRSKRNLTRTLVDTALSRFAKSETRVQFMTDGGTPAQQERSETCTQAANALIEQTKSERQLRKAALHACVFDIGAVKAIENENGPETEHVPAWEVMFDPQDSHRGNPTVLVQKFPADREALISRFVPPKDENDTQERQDARQQLVEDIRNSGNGPLVTPDHTQSSQHVIVYELWKLPVGSAKGRHVVVTDHALILAEEWTDEEFPFVFFVWSEPVKGVYGESIAAIVSELQAEIDGSKTRKSQILRLCAIPLWTLEGGAADATVGTVDAQVTGGSGAIGDIVRVPAGATLTRVPVGNIIEPALNQAEEEDWAKGFEMTGINQSSAIGTRPAGLNSAPAQREWNEINQDRLSLVALEYQQAHVDLAERLLSAVAKIPDFVISVKDPNGRWLKRVKASELNLDNSDYVIQRFPISALPTTPTGKLAAAADLLQSGAIDPDDFKEIVQLPDLKARLDINLSVRKAAEKIVSKMLTTGQYIAPPDALVGDPQKYAAKFATAKLLEGIAADPEMPDTQQQLLTNWLGEIARKTAPPKPDPAAALPPGAGAPPTPGGLPPGIAPLPPQQFAPLPPPMESMAA